MDILEQSLYQAEKGKKIIDACAADGGAAQMFLIFPDSDVTLLDAAYRHLETVMKKAGHVAVITDIDEVAGRLNGYPELSVRTVTHDDMKCVLRFASMAQIDIPEIKIMSLRKPHSQRGELLPGLKDIDMDTAVVRGLYGIFGEYE